MKIPPKTFLANNKERSIMGAKSLILSIFIAAVLLIIPVEKSYAGKCSKAEKLLEEAAGLISKNPNDAEAILLEAIRLCRDSASIHYNLGVVRYKLEKYKNAIASFNSARELAEKAVDVEAENKAYLDTLNKVNDPYA